MIEIINNIPTVLSFFLPGYIGLVIFKAICGISLRDYESFAASCAGSYIIIGFIRLVQGAEISTLSPISFPEFILASIIAVFSSCLGTLLFQSNRFRNFLSQKFNYAPVNDTWQNIYDYENGTRVAFKMKTGKYVRGQIVTMGDIHADPWIELNNYDVFDTDANPDDDNQVEAKGLHPNQHIMVNANDIEYALIVKDSEK